MAALKLMVELRKRHGRPAPESTAAPTAPSSRPARRALLDWLARGLRSGAVPDQLRAELRRGRGGGERAPGRLLAARCCWPARLPDYWQRFERYRAAHAEQRLAAPGRARAVLKRLFG